MTATVTDPHGESTLRLVWMRWGGGAEPGKYHVFLIGADLIEWLTGVWPYGRQCVVDDFGDLVVVS